MERLSVVHHFITGKQVTPIYYFKGCMMAVLARNDAFFPRIPAKLNVPFSL